MERKRDLGGFGVAWISGSPKTTQGDLKPSLCSIHPKGVVTGGKLLKNDVGVSLNRLWRMERKGGALGSQEVSGRSGIQAFFPSTRRVVKGGMRKSPSKSPLEGRKSLPYIIGSGAKLTP